MRSKFKWIFTLLLAFSMQFSFAQEKTVTGTVTEGGLPLPGVSVVIKGTTRGTQTDMDGKYSIKAKTGEVLVFSFIGMKDSSATVGASNSVNVAMTTVAKELENVVIGAMGIKKRQDAQTSSNQVVKSKEITQASQPNVIQSLAGKVSGLQINTTSNGVSASTKVVLRGSRSITGNNEALVVIDNAISSLSVLGTLPPETIESVNIIKGQQGGALYGEQGANGVIIVTTKKGSKSGKIAVSLNSSIDFQSVSFLPKRQEKYGQGWGYGYDFDFPNAADPRNSNVQFEPIENGAWGPSFNDPLWAGTVVPVGLPQANGQFLTTEWKSRGTDNIKDFFRTGAIYQNGVSVNMGSEDGYVLFSYNNQTSNFIVDKDRMQKNSFLFKAGKKINKLSIDGGVTYVNQSISQTDSNLLDDLSQTPTNININDFRNSGHAGHWTVYAKNPFTLVDQIRNDDKSDLFIGNLGLNYALTKNISLTYNGNIRTNYTNSTSHDDGYNLGNIAYNFSPYNDNSFGNNPLYSDFTTDYFNGGSFYSSTNFQRRIYSDILVNFDYDLTKDLNFKLNLGGNAQDAFTKNTQQGGTGLDTPGFYHVTNVLNPANPVTLNNNVSRTRRIATFANMDLDYKGYLFLNATARYEKASTVINPFFYPSAGLSFIPTKAFEGMKGNVLNYMKLSASWVRTGNATPVAAYRTNVTGTIAPGFPFGDLAGYQYNTSGANPLVKPEFITTKEVGASFGFFKDRVTLDGSYYITNTTKMITNSTASSTSGLVSILNNTGELENKGFEIDLGLTPFRSENNGFNWNLRGSLTHYKTKVLSLSNGVDAVNLTNTSETNFTALGVGVFAQVGEEFPLIKGTKYQRDDQGHVIVDANGNPLRTSSFEKLGKANPDYIIGLTNTFSYKGISLTAVADYRTGHSVWSQTYQNLQYDGMSLVSASQDRDLGYVVPNSVQQTGPGIYTANTTPVNNQIANKLAGTTDFFGNTFNRIGENSIIDATTLKIREIALSYEIPSKMLKNTGIQSFKLGVNARNAFVFFFDGGHGIKNKGYTDPEASNTTGNGQGISNTGQYPTTKSYGVSLNLTF